MAEQEYFNRAAETICSAIRSDFPKMGEDGRKFMSEFRKRFRSFLSTLPDAEKSYNTADGYLSDAEEIAWIWLGRNYENLMEINTFLFEEQGFHLYDWDLEDGNYVEFKKVTDLVDYEIILSKTTDSTTDFPFRSINQDVGMIPQDVSVSITAYEKNYHSESITKRVIFQGLRIDMKDELTFLHTLLNKFLCIGE